MTKDNADATGGHTAGPWSLPHFAHPDINCECGYILTDGMMGAVATVHCSGEGDDWIKGGDNPKFAQAVANARLIAAAPDLLEALRAIYLARNTDSESDWLRATILSDAAIARATGATP